MQSKGIHDSQGQSRQGFTLIELSIVLVIIGLIVGGVLVGQDLIAAATIRAQVTQIEKYNTAVNTFYTKYNALPGDIAASVASQFGLTARTGATGDGDANGIIEGSSCTGDFNISGEISTFWNDLGVAGLIESRFKNNTNASTNTITNGGTLPGSAYLPAAKIGNNNYINVWSGGYGLDNNTGGIGTYSDSTCGWPPPNGFNYFGILTLPSGSIQEGLPDAAPGMSVAQAYAVDIKMDDGLPQTGNVLALYVTGLAMPGPHGWSRILWAQGGVPPGNNHTSAPSLQNPAATQGSSGTCFDNSTDTTGQNGASANNPMHYSMEMQSGANINCALSFKMQ